MTDMTCHRKSATCNRYGKKRPRESTNCFSNPFNL